MIKRITALSPHHQWRSSMKMNFERVKLRSEWNITLVKSHIVSHPQKKSFSSCCGTQKKASRERLELKRKIVTNINYCSWMQQQQQHFLESVPLALHQRDSLWPRRIPHLNLLLLVGALARERRIPRSSRCTTNKKIQCSGRIQLNGAARIIWKCYSFALKTMCTLWPMPVVPRGESHSFSFVKNGSSSSSSRKCSARKYRFLRRLNNKIVRAQISRTAKRNMAK